nr:thermonuclease family protein [Zhongshania antarctica]
MVLHLFWSSIASAGTQGYGNVVVDTVTTIYDGDTFRATINDWPPIIGKNIPIRVNGIDTPEMRGGCREEIEQARKAKQEAVAMIRAAKVVELRNINRDKYFRIVADVYLDGKSLGDSLIGKGLAKTYDGGKKEKWCLFSTK